MTTDLNREDFIPLLESRDKAKDQLGCIKAAVLDLKAAAEALREFVNEKPVKGGE